MNSRVDGVAAEHDPVATSARGRSTPCRGRTGRRRSTGAGRRRRRWPSMLRRGRRALVQRVGPVLDADRAAEERVVRVRDVAGGEDVGVARAQVLVDDDAVVDREPGRLGELDRAARRRRRPPRRRPSSVARRRELDALDAPAPSIASTPVPRRSSTPWAACRSRVDRADLARRARARAARRPARRRHLARRAARADAATSQPIQPAPITTTRRAAPRRAAQRVGVAERAQVVHAVEVGARHAAAARGRRRWPAAAGRSAIRSPPSSTTCARRASRRGRRACRCAARSSWSA